MSTSITIPDSVHNSFIHQALGFAGCWSGLAPRIIMIGTLTALQWFIYDGVKVALGLPRYDASKVATDTNILGLRTRYRTKLGWFFWF